MSNDSATRAQSATERAFYALKQDILNAVLPPQQQFLEGELAERLGMSRTPVREACIRLQSEGLIEIIPRRGVRVVAVSAQDMGEVYDLLGTLEGRAAELAAERAGEEELDALDGAVERMARALAADDLESWAAADAEFHRLLVEASGNRHLILAVARYTDLVHRARMVTLRLRPRPDQSVADHRELAQVIRSGDSRRAHDLHRDHRRQVAGQLTTLLQSLSLGGI